MDRNQVAIGVSLDEIEPSGEVGINVNKPHVIEITIDKTGPQGFSAYDLAVRNGFTGTLTEWEASLQGRTPVKGIDFFTTEDKVELFSEFQRHSDSNYTYEQIQPLALWTITHSMEKYPSVTVVDSAGSVVIGEIHYVSLDELTVAFIGAFSGKAYLN